MGDSPASLQPGAEAKVPLTFTPDAAERYSTVVPFQVNGLYVVNVSVKGEGVPLRVEMIDRPVSWDVPFGRLRATQSATREFKFVNRSRLPATIRLDDACVEAL